MPRASTSSSASQRNSGGNANPRASTGLAGIIRRVELTNFMCHAHLVLDLNPRVNMVVGKNGSGKSAIMAALMVVLGTKASDTARGRSLAAFVRLGCRQGIVKITLSNDGPNSYKVQRYGKQIIFTRTIAVKGSSRLTVALASGNVTTCTKAELVEVLQALNISLPNPFALLTQETMKTFLHNNKPTQMYTLIEQGTGVTAIKVRLAELKGKVAGLIKKKSQMESSMKKVEEQLKTWKAKQKQLKQTHEASSRVERLQLELVWAGARDEEEKEQQMTGRLEALCAEQTTYQAKIEKLANLKEEIKERIRVESVDWTNARSLYNEKKREREGKQQQHVKSQSRIDELRRSMNAIDSNLRSKNQEIKLLQAEISKIANQSGDAEVRKRAREQEELEDKKRKLAQAKEELHPLVPKLDDERQQLRYMQRQVNNAKEHMETTKQAHKSAEQEYERVRKQTSASVVPPAFGARMPDLLKELDRAAQKGSFKHKPIGPIGLHMKLKDYSWSLAVENLLRSEMTVFFCDNFNDRKTLDAMARRILGQAVPCVVSKFFDRPFDINNTKAVAPEGLLSLLDILDIDDPRLFNYFLDQRRVENVLLCANTQQALHLMQRQDSVPRKCNLVVTKDAEQVYPWPNFKVYGKECDVNFLIKSREANVALYEQRVASTAEDRKAAEVEWRQIDDEYRSLRERVANHEARRKTLESTVDRLETAIRSAESLQPVNTVDNLETLQDELADMQTQVDEVQAQKQHAAEARAEAENTKEQFARELIKLAAEFQALDEKCLQCERRKQQLETQMEAEESSAQSRQQRLQQLAQKRAQQEAEVAAQRKKVAEVTATASQVGERVNTHKDKNSIQKEIDRQNTFIKKLNHALEDEATVEREVARLQEKVENDKANLDVVVSNLEDMEEGLNKRVGIYGTTVINTYTHINLYFSNLFDSQPIKGSLIVNLEEKTMSIKTEFQGRGNEGAQNLSGGERSFTTVALVLAVWNKLLIPFYMLDEFDVFMDMANRRRATDMLLQEAENRPSNQFIFFTPQELNLAAQPHITIHQLSDPRAS